MFIRPKTSIKNHKPVNSYKHDRILSSSRFKTVNGNINNNADCALMSFGRKNEPQWMTEQKRLRKQIEDIQTMDNDMKLYADNVVRTEFFGSADRKGMFNHSQRHQLQVDQQNMDELAKKKDRLKHQLLFEDQVDWNTLKQWNKIKVQDDIKIRHDRLLARKADREHQRLKFVEEKNMQKLLNNCDTIRPYLRQTLLRDSKTAQLLQIKDNEKIQQCEKDNEKMWWEIQQICYQQMLQREKDEKQMEKLRNLNMINVLNGQIEELRIQRQNQRKEELITFSDDQLTRHLRSDEKKNAENLEKRKFVANIQQQQIKEAKNATVAFNEQDRKFDLTSNEIAKTELAKIKAKEIDRKKSAMKETHYFMDYLKTIQNDNKIKEQENDKFLKDYREKCNQSEREKQKEFREKLRASTKATYEYCWNQINEQKMQAINEQQRQQEIASNERAAFLENEKQYQAAEKLKHDMQLQYGRELKGQIKFVDYLKQNEIRQEKEELQKCMANENECETLAKEFLKKKIDLLPIHPNRFLTNLSNL